MHIYQSVGAYSSAAKAFLDVDGNPSKFANYRGETSPIDDPESFSARMAKRGHVVIVTDELVDPGEVLETARGNFIAHYNAAFVVDMDNDKIVSVNPKQLTPAEH
jgi:hypothetical protein